MSKIPTATELIRNKFPRHDGIFVLKNIEEFMIEFARFHVERALQTASRNATMKVEYPDECYQDSNEYGQSFICAHEVEHNGENGNISIEKESILNSYPLDQIE